MAWQKMAADVLIDNRKQISEFLPTTPCIYLWKRNFRSKPSDNADAKAFVDWIERTICAPVAELGPTRIAHFVTFRGLSISGELTESKRRYLQHALKHDALRAYMRNYLAALADQAPALYVGETEHMARRASEHLDGKTDFGETINQHNLLVWADLDLHYWVMSTKEANPSDTETKFRTAIEAITGNATIAGLTKRPG
jgi:hypothetical protein